jgi:hypothetical protein
MPQAPATEARHEIARLLRDIDDVEVRASWPQGAVSPPMVVVRPREPWMRPITLQRTEVSLYVDVAVLSTGSNDDAIEQLETLIWQVAALLREGGMLVSEVGAPTLTEINTAQLLVSTTEITVHVDDLGA